MNEQEHIPEAERVNLADVDVSPIIKEMREYNKQFSMGRMMADALSEELPGEDAHTKEKQTSMIAAKQQFDPLLYRTGMDIESVQGGVKMFSSKGAWTNAELRINISDRDRFIQYLEALDPEKITEGQSRSLAAVFESLTLQLKREYDLNDTEDDRMIELLAGLGKMLQEVDRLDPENTLGIVHSTENLRVYYEALQHHHLSEYLLAERAGLLVEVGTHQYGPSSWQIDVTPENYEKRWGQAIEILSSIKKSERSGIFFDKLKGHLLECLDYAMKDMAQKISSGSNVKYHTPLMEIADRYYDELTAV